MHVVLMGNGYPDFGEHTAAFGGRAIVIPFRVSFADGVERGVTIGTLRLLTKRQNDIVLDFRCSCEHRVLATLAASAMFRQVHHRRSGALRKTDRSGMYRIEAA
jgi:hypothetical protein